MDEKILPFKKLGISVDVQGITWNGDLDYRALFEQTGDCVFIISLDFKILEVNPQANRMLGYSEGELPGNYSDIFLSLDNSVPSVTASTNLASRHIPIPGNSLEEYSTWSVSRTLE